MAEKDHDGPNNRHTEDTRADNPEAVLDNDSKNIDLDCEAITHLLVAWEQFETQSRLLVSSVELNQRQSVIDDLMRIRNTLVVLEKPASRFVVEELLAALQHDVTADVKNGELARVLLSAVRHLGKHFRQLQNNVDLDSALALVPLVNDCRAYRDEMLLSDVLMLAAGIDLPDTPVVSVSEKSWSEQRKVWVDCASGNHMSLVQRLLHWWRSEHAGSVGPLLRQLDRFAALSENHDYLNSLTPLFQCSALVANAIKGKQLDDGPAIRSLFAQLERNVHRCALVAAPDDLVPADLLRNFLYYVAQIDVDTALAISLRRRFRLDRVRQIARSANSYNTPTIGVGYHLTNAIRNGIARETEPLRAWLDEPTTVYVYSTLVRLRVRLGQLEPTLTIMGAKKPLQCLVSINSQLSNLKKDQVIDEAIRLELAQLLIQLDALLDQSARRSILQTRAEKSVEVSSRDIYVDIATDSCIREARNELQILSNDLLPLIASETIDAHASRRMIVKLDTVNSALQILPLPELNSLFKILEMVIFRLSKGFVNLPDSQPADANAPQGISQPKTLQAMFSHLLASLDDYLGCVLLPQPLASQFLANASETLDDIMKALDFRAILSDEVDDDTLPADVVEPLLVALSSIGEALASYSAQDADNSISQLDSALSEMQQLSDIDTVPVGLRRLASSASIWLKQTVASENALLSDDNLSVLDEVHGLFPMLLTLSSDESKQVDGLDELVHKLEREAMDAPDEVSANPEPLLDDLALPDIGSLTLNVDDDLLLESVVVEESRELDETLQLVFQHECLGHLESLDESVRLALKPNVNSDVHLPNEQMLRALHTLTGSAQTINAIEVIAIVLPLQRAALSLHREGRYFDAGQTRYIGDLVVAIRARIDSLNSKNQVDEATTAIERKLGAFLSATVPGIAENESKTTTALSIGARIRSLEDVFSDEASEILDKLRRVVRSSVFDEKALNAALHLLHTLKGSARMAGKLSISECAHGLESQLQDTVSKEQQLVVLKDGYRSLHGYLLQSTARRISLEPAEKKADHKSSDALFTLDDKSLVVGSEMVGSENLLDMATDLNVNHARLSEELAQLHGVCQDIDSTSFRWRTLLVDGGMPESPAMAEMLADMEAVRLVLRNSLRQAERQQQQASRVSANLQQSLIRARLCSLDGMQDRLSDTVSDVARICGVSTRFVMSGGDIMIDKDLFKQLAAPLEHIARNSVVHGIEPAEQRLARGKPGTGTITLNAYIDGTELVLKFSDDGRGVSCETLNPILQARGEPRLANDEELQNTLFQAGFSSINNADAIAGHGLGLSAVKSAVEQMRGRIRWQSAVDAGVQITLRIPQSMVVKQVVLVRDGGKYYGIPVIHVKSVQLAGHELKPQLSEVQGVSILQLLGEPEKRGASVVRQSSVSIVVDELSLLIEVDEIIGYRELVTQPLGAQLDSLNRYSDGSVLPAGQQVLIVDFPSLMKSSPQVQSMIEKGQPEEHAPIALIVDDSHTTRSMARKVLCKDGFEVQLSKDGLDALASIGSVWPDVMIVDLEMPRLDGFGLLRQLAQTNTGDLPPVIVLSHNDNSHDRQMAMELGVVRFLVKPFDEDQLQEAIKAVGLTLPDMTIA